MKRQLGVGAALGALTLAFAIVPTPAAAAMPTCATPTQSNYFLGNGMSRSGLKGVYTEIERLGEHLCTQGSPIRGSWSLAWISLDGPQRSGVGGINIFQGGYAQCPPPTVNSCPYNGGVIYYWDYYAHDGSGPCGIPFNTGFVNEGNPTAGYHFFQISKVGAQYQFFIDEHFIRARGQADIETCWPTINGGEWQNETLNPNDQAGGHVSNPQGFHNNQYQTATGWHNANRTLGSSCDANSNPAHWHCHTSSGTANGFDTYDDRVP